ncbi:hypothetical protein FIC_02174 [Flavobacteriaceae bacterium 3519-10]|nr:hypothetical protein FIC_02174 [Flavobacteriaceae bacterium 3519-10]
MEILSARRNDAQKDWERKTEKGAKKIITFYNITAPDLYF